MGRLKLVKDPKKYTKISTSTDGVTVVCRQLISCTSTFSCCYCCVFVCVCVKVVSALTENLGYHKVSVFSPYWMINKTGLDIDYLVSWRERESRKVTHRLFLLQVDGKAIKHPSNKSLVLLSTSNPKNDVRDSFSLCDYNLDWSVVVVTGTAPSCDPSWKVHWLDLQILLEWCGD